VKQELGEDGGKRCSDQASHICRKMVLPPHGDRIMPGPRSAHHNPARVWHENNRPKPPATSPVAAADLVDRTKSTQRAYTRCWYLSPCFEQMVMTRFFDRLTANLPLGPTEHDVWMHVKTFAEPAGAAALRTPDSGTAITFL
jgi:hypothetical protein